MSFPAFNRRTDCPTFVALFIHSLAAIHPRDTVVFLYTSSAIAAFLKSLPLRFFTSSSLSPKEPQVKQAVDYAANQGVDWVLLTNGFRWCVYRVFFTRPIGQELVVDLDLSTLNPRSDSDLETLYLWCKEGWQRSALGEFHTQKQALSRFFLGATILSDPVLEVVRRELRRVSPDVRIDIEQIRTVLVNEVLKREVMEDPKADEARKKIARAANKALRAKEAKADGAQPETPSAASEGSTDESLDV